MATPNPMPVPFHGSTLYVIDHNGEPFTPMKPIVEAIGVSWQGQYEKLKSNAQRWGIKEILIPSKGGEQKSVCVPLRKLPGWLMSIHANKVKPELKEKVIQFQNECDDVLWQHWNKNHPVSSPIEFFADSLEGDEMEWHFATFDGHRIRVAAREFAWFICGDDLAKIVRQSTTFDLMRHAPARETRSFYYFGEQLEMLTPPGAFIALSKVRTANAPALADYLSRELFENGAIAAHAVPNQTDYDQARQLFEENPLKFLGPRRWMLSVDNEGQVTARTLSENEHIVDQHELREVKEAFDKLEHFVNYRELRLAFPKQQH